MKSSIDENVDPFIVGFAIKDDSNIEELNWEAVKSATANVPGERRWIHLNRLSDEARAWLEGAGSLDPLIVNVLFQEDTRPRSTRLGEGFLINLRGANLNPGAEPEDLISLRIWATKDLIVTTRAYRIRAIEDLRDEFHSLNPPVTNGEIVCFLAERLTTRLEPIVGQLEDQADELEAEWLDLNTPAPKLKLAEFRRSALSLRRYIAPQREAISSFIRESGDFLSDESRLKLREVQDITTRFAEDLDLARERAVVIQEQIVEQRAESMNQRLFVLAIISAIFLPLGFLTGLFGINIGGMPGVDSPYAFWLFATFLVVVTGGLLYAFKRMNWL
ncbi:MAG: zinc transporter ZntB [Henriciella sp.]